ncbi:MAG: type I pullulanase [Erysipelotrichaceae bacterium]
MKLKRILIGVLTTLLLLTPLLSLRAPINANAATQTTLTIHYNRPAGDYAGWNLWLWEVGKDGKAYPFETSDAFGKVLTVTLDTAATEFGFIVRLNEWEKKDIDSDRFITASGGKAEVWLKSGDATVYTSKPSLDPVVDPKPVEGDITIKVHYHRFDNNYADWNFWMWPKGGVGAAYPLNGEDSYGKIATLKMAPGSATDIGILVRKGEWLVKDIDSDRFIPLSKLKNKTLEIWLLQGDPKIYYSAGTVDLSPKFLGARLDGVDLVSVSLSVPMVLLNDKKEGLTLKDSDGKEVFFKTFIFSEGTGLSTSSNFKFFTQTPLDLSKSYTLSKAGYGSIKLTFNTVFNTKAFEATYGYDGELGAIYTPTQTTFRLWAPTATNVVLNIYVNGTDGDPKATYPMKADVKGTWVYTSTSDMNGVYYTYSVTALGNTNEAVDPYARGVGVNGKRGMVLDLATTDPKGWDSVKRPAFKNSTDAIIYEAHIRDLTVSPDSGITNKGKFLGLSEENTKTPSGIKTGLSHLVELGVTHLHLLPVFDFRSIDETTLDKNSFNWGYDPQNFNVPEGSYSTDPYKGEVRVKEFKEMVMALHKNDIRVIMDVVYNHTGASADSDFSKIVPNYYYRYNENGTFSNGSGTGNETASDRIMMRKFIVDSVVYWATEYKVDGFRFDLMALHDIETMNAVRAALDKVDPTILIYGEGWTGGASTLPLTEQSLKKNIAQIDGVAAFSDDIRDAIKGFVFNNLDKGFVNGGLGLEESIKFGIIASTMNINVDYTLVKYSKTPYAKEPSSVVSYVEAHDNLTLWDKLKLTNPDATEDELIAMDRMANAIILTSQGISFLHAGSDFLRTKDGNGNSYNAPDAINQLVWERKGTYIDTFKYFQGLIAMRKAHPAFRSMTSDLIRKNLAFLTMPEKNMVGYTLSNHSNKDSWGTIAVLMNANDKAIDVTLEKAGWAVMVNGEKAGTKSLATISGKTITVQPHTLMVLVDSSSVQSSYIWVYLFIGLAIGLGVAAYYMKRKGISPFKKKA